MTMLDRMRRHKAWLKWSLGLVVLAFVVFYIPDFLTPQITVGAAPGEVIAEVNGEELTAGEFQRRYTSQVQSYRTAYGAAISPQMLKQLGIDQQILQQMVDEQAALAEAQRQGIRVSDEELAQQIFAIPGLQENGRFVGEATYERILQSQNPPMTKSEFEENLRRSMMIDKLRSALTDWMVVSDEEIEREFKLRNEKVKLQVVALTADKFRDKVTVTDADVSTYFDAHKAEYRKGEQRKVKMLLLDRQQIHDKTIVPPADIQRAYNDNIQQYQTPEQVRASHILLKTEGKTEADVRKVAEDVLKQVKAGGDFAELAKKYSEDEGSKANGGDLDYFTRGRMVPEFETAAFSLQPGQVSDLVKSQFGFHIIKVIDKKAAVTRTLDEVKPQIEDQLKFERADQQIAQRAAELAAKIKTAADLDREAKSAGLQVVESGFFAKEDPVPGLGAAPQVATAAFELKDNAVSAPIPSPRGTVFVTVTGKKDPYVPMLDEVKERVRQDLIRVRATELSRQRAGEIAAALKSAKDFAAAAKAQGLEAKDTELVARNAALPDIGVNPEVDKVAFSLPVNGVSDPISTGDGTVIIRVAERDEVTPDELKKDKETFRSQLLNERRNLFYSAYMTKVKEKMNIQINNDVVTRVSSQLGV
jgi:peptidyl-prolyl cis-trans isomerase D